MITQRAGSGRQVGRARQGAGRQAAGRGGGCSPAVGGHHASLGIEQFVSHAEHWGMNGAAAQGGAGRSSA